MFRRRDPWSRSQEAGLSRARFGASDQGKRRLSQGVRLFHLASERLRKSRMRTRPTIISLVQHLRTRGWSLHFTLPLKAPVKAKELNVEIYIRSISWTSPSGHYNEPIALVGAPAGVQLVPLARPRSCLCHRVSIWRGVLQYTQRFPDWALNSPTRISVKWSMRSWPGAHERYSKLLGALVVGILFLAALLDDACAHGSRSRAASDPRRSLPAHRGLAVAPSRRVLSAIIPA